MNENQNHINPQDLKQIKTMLEAQLRSANHVHWISGWAPGRSSTGDPYIILYPANKKLNLKICRVWPRDLGKLPPFIQTDPDAWPERCANGRTVPERPQAQAAGYYHDCPLFKIVTYDGREIQGNVERRFHDVLVVTNKTL